MTQRPALQRTSLTSGRDAQSTKIGSEIACCQAAYGGNEEMSSLTKCLARATPASGEAGHDAVVSSIYIPGLGKNELTRCKPKTPQSHMPSARSRTRGRPRPGVRA